MIERGRRRRADYSSRQELRYWGSDFLSYVSCLPLSAREEQVKVSARNRAAPLSGRAYDISADRPKIEVIMMVAVQTVC